MASEIRVNQIQSRTGVSTVSFTDSGPILAGVSTVQGSLTVDEDLTVGGNVSIGGTLTYEDVTNIDSVGIITAQSGIHVTGGSVGIGTDNPDHNLHIYKNAGDAVITIESTGNDNDSALEFKRTSSSGDSKGAGSIYVTGDTSASEARMHFGVGHNITHGSSPKMTIMGNGEVGIGTTNPGVRLHIRNDSGELARFQINDQTASGRIVCVGGTASYSGINFGDLDNVDAGRIRHYNDDNSDAHQSFLFYTNDTARIVLNRYGLLTNYPGSNSAETGGTILGRYKYTQRNQSQNYEHVILGPDGRKLQNIIDTNCFCVITVCVTGTGTDNMFCQYHYVANQAPNAATLTHIAGNSSASANRPYMLLVNTYDPAWKMNHSGTYTQDIEVAIYGGNDQYTYTNQFGKFEANP